MRKMGNLAGVPIEPPEQTAILDATLAIPGVLIAGVPGAGGYDAICVLAIHEHAISAIEKLWMQWPKSHPNSIICPLLCNVDRGVTSSSSVYSGLQLHSCRSLHPVDTATLHTSQPTIKSRMSLAKRKYDEVDGIENDTLAEINKSTMNNEPNDQVNMLEEKQYGEFSIPGLRFATESWAGMKTSNEDRHVSCASYFPGQVFGVFDGHGGTFTADFLSSHLIRTVASFLHQRIGAKALSTLQRSREMSRQEDERKHAIVKQVNLLRKQLVELEDLKLSESTDDVHKLVDQLANAISQIDSEVSQLDKEQAARELERRTWCQENHTLFLKCFRDAFARIDSQILMKNQTQDGSTALLAWFLADTARLHDQKDAEESAEIKSQQIDELSFYLVNVGDCRAVMCRSGRGIALTSDHKPDRIDEQKRIEKAGGFVSKIAGIPRVYSAAGAGLAIDRESSTYLAVSRAFGDRSLKIPTALVSCEPEIKRVEVHPDDLFLILACDGVWDVLSAQDAVDITLPHFYDAKAAANAVVKAAYKKGSTDNLTVTVIQFGWKSNVQVIESCKTASSRPNQDENLPRADEAEEEIDMFSY
ncbi:phosphomevalonate kinase [Plasmopara halstedii]|uniref:Phosphomevalonate kinase n=1 Tax=Plasmopara halstedii TaxID=4781 RepID=A0A0P1AA67_PLAHL|nr:phosphomevalonate kinase [Plasmopara halstedii]CEG37025.1 phosphomevalonate kinase [Plasmopara halstedii]|eukprot:XP_024573394.1 phosphomevalonate kinase [Plasmopara halstedii]